MRRATEDTLSPAAGSSLLTLMACVVGAAIAATHLQHAQGVRLREQLSGLFWLVFIDLTLVSAGPFVLLARWRMRFDRHWVWSWNWAAMGLPWVGSLPWAMAKPATNAPQKDSGTYQWAIIIGTIVGLVLLVVLWYRSSRDSPDHDRGDAAERERPARIGMLLALLWPVQVVAALILAGP